MSDWSLMSIAERELALRPLSERLDECNRIVDALRRLERHHYELSRPWARPGVRSKSFHETQCEEARVKILQIGQEARHLRATIERAKDGF